MAKKTAIADSFLSDLQTGTLPTQMAEWTLEQGRTWWLEFRRPRIATGTLTAEGFRLKPMIRLLGNIRLKQITACKSYRTDRQC